MYKLYFSVLLILLCSLSAGCNALGSLFVDEQEEYERIFSENNKKKDPVIPTATSDNTSVGEFSEYLTEIMNNPQSPSVYQEIPGYFNFRGILAAGGDIDLVGYSRVVGGVYSRGELKMASGSMIVEDVSYIMNVYNAFQFNPDSVSKVSLNIFKNYSYNGQSMSHPIDMSKIPKRVKVLQYQEIELKNGETFPDVNQYK